MIWICVTGCTTIKPGSERYSFIVNDRQYGAMAMQLYDPALRNATDKVKLAFSYPEGHEIAFGPMAMHPIDPNATEPLAVSEGMYPFKLQAQGSGAAYLSGALMVYNLNKEIGLATLGLTDDTRLFRAELVEKAKNGTLVSHTIRFDNTEVLTYWLGNRTDGYRGGNPTVQVDFSGTPDIESLKINGRTIPGFEKVLRVYDLSSGGATAPEVKSEYKIEFQSGSKTYVGYLRNLEDNEFTAFMRIPCAIPQNLLDAAAEGTVSKFTVQSTGDQKERVAEIVISAK